MASAIKVKLLILDSDLKYRDRFVYALTNQHSGEFELFVYGGLDEAIECANKRRIDVFLASSEFDVDTNRLPGYCSFAYLVDSAAIAMYKNESAIGKYQKLSAICNEIRLLHANHLSDVEMKGDGSSRIYVFSSPAGGVGTTTLSVAYCNVLVRKGYRVLYLNFEPYGDTSLYFDRKNSKADMETVIYELLSNNPDRDAKKGSDDGKVNREQKILGLVELAEGGIDYIPSPKNAAVYNDIHENEIHRLINIYSKKGKYNAIVVDLPFQSYGFMTKLVEEVDRVVMVTDGSVEGNSKTLRAIEAMSAINSVSVDYITLIYNRNSSKNSQMLEIKGLHQTEGIGRIEGASPRELVAEISGRAVLEEL